MELTRRNLNALVVLSGAVALLAGCSGSDWEAVSYESGDTTVVQTVAGSVWGGSARLVERARIAADPADSLDEPRSLTALASGPNGDVYVVDGEMPAVRLYDRDGRYVRVFVVPFGEPGHYSQPNGVAVLSDGRVVIRDPRRSQMVVYSPRGVFLERWPHPSGVYSPIPLISDVEDRLYTRVVFNPGEPREEWKEVNVSKILDAGIIGFCVHPDDDATLAMSRMIKNGLGRVPVIDSGKLTGIVSNKDIMQILRHKIDLNV